MVEWEWDLGLYRGARSLLRMLRKRDAGADPQRAARSARLADCQPALTALAGALSAMPLRIVPVNGAGGVRGRELLLPEAMDLAADPAANRELYVLRTAVSAAIARLGLAATKDTALPPPLPALRAVAEACAWLAQEFPGLHARLENARALALAARPAADGFQGREALRERARRAALRGETPWDDAAVIAALREARERWPVAPGEALFGEQLETGALAAVSPIDGSPAARPCNPESEADAPRVGSVERVLLEKDERGDIVLNPFERIETLDSYRGGSRNLDGADDLDAHLEALSEVDLGKSDGWRRAGQRAAARRRAPGRRRAGCCELRAVRGRHSVRRVELSRARISPRLVHGVTGIGRGDRRKLGRRRQRLHRVASRNCAAGSSAIARGCAVSIVSSTARTSISPRWWRSAPL